MTDWPAGTIATATVCGVKGVRVMRTSDRTAPWVSVSLCDGFIGYHDANLADVRPLVVLDPEDPRVKAFLALSYYHPGSDDEAAWGVAQTAAIMIEEQIFELSRIAEPGELTFVTAGYGAWDRCGWVRFEGTWHSLNGRGVTADWDVLIDPEVIA